MPITLGSNIASLRAQRKLADGTAALSKTFERLSSGQRINRASDDAAGLAIADSLGANSRIFNQGVRNLNDGLSLLSIADSAIENLSGIMIRLEELATQAANGVYSNQQRKALDAEAQALSKEFFRISKATEFNGQRLFTGEKPVVSLQAGVGTAAILSVGVGGALGTGKCGAAAGFATDIGSSSGGSLAVALGDVNGDGIVDLVTAGGTNNGGGGNQGQASVSLGLGNGSFGGARTLATITGSSSGGSYAMTLGDVNGDGVLDLVTAGWANNGSGDQGQASVSLGLGNGSFGTAITSATNSGSIAGRSYAVTLGDVNGDGIVDLVTAGVSGNQGYASVLLGLGNGSFSEALTFATDTGSSSGRSLAVSLGDVNGDGILDLITAGLANNGSGIQGQASVLLGLGNGSFGSATTFATETGSSYGYSRAVTLGDVNGDGILDLITAGLANNGSGNQGQASVSLGSGNGSFAETLTFATDTGSSSGSSRAVSLGDVNGDGVLDLVTAGWANNGMSNQGQASVALGSTTPGVAPLLDFSLRTLADARQALPVFKRKREQLATQRGQIGAFQSRIQVATNVLTVSGENFKAAESRIRDADIAEESSRLVRLNILQQAASSVLAQANQQPALALQLLTGR